MEGRHDEVSLLHLGGHLPRQLHHRCLTARRADVLADEVEPRRRYRRHAVFPLHVEVELKIVGPREEGIEVAGKVLPVLDYPELIHETPGPSNGHVCAVKEFRVLLIRVENLRAQCQGDQLTPASGITTWAF